MRPRSSYRSEDVLALMRAHCIQHGIPGQWRLEQGVWKSNLVKNAVANMGADLHTVWSPHQKPYIEGLFNVLWTKLSVHFPDSDVGRFRGETEKANELLVACQRGQRDPRRHFPTLKTALASFTEVIMQKNATPVNSKASGGRWEPAEVWNSRPDNLRNFPARALDASQEWTFSPFVREWTVKGTMVGGTVPLLEDYSIPFDFQADWLWRYNRAKVRAHFDPGVPACKAMLVLAQNWAGTGEKAGTPLGYAQQINDVAGHVRLILGYGDDLACAGRLAKQQVAGAVRCGARPAQSPVRAKPFPTLRPATVWHRDSFLRAPNPRASRQRSKRKVRAGWENYLVLLK